MRQELEIILKALESEGYRCIVDEANSTIIAEVTTNKQIYNVLLRIYWIFGYMSIEIQEYITNVTVACIPEIKQFIDLFNRNQHKIELKLDNGTIRIVCRDIIALSTTKVLILTLRFLVQTAVFMHPFLHKIMEGKCSVVLIYNEWKEQREKDVQGMELWVHLAELANWEARRALLHKRCNILSDRFVLMGVPFVQRLVESGEYSEADGWFRLMIEACTLLGEVAIPFLAPYVAELGRLRMKQEDYQEAERLILYALQLFVQKKDLVCIANCNMDLGVIHYESGKYTEAKGFYRLAQQQYKQLGRREDVVICDINLGSVYYKLGEYFIAKTIYQKARQECVQFGFQKTLAICDMVLANIHFIYKEYPEAERLLIDAHKWFEMLDERLEIALCDVNLASVYILQERYSEAESLLLQSRAGFEQWNMPQKVAECDLNLAILHLHQGMYSEAIPILKTVAESEFDSLRWHALSRLGHLYSNPDFQQHNETFALNYLEEAAEVLEEMRGKQRSDIDKMLFFDDKTDDYSEIVRLYWKRKDYKQAYNYVERGKSRSLLDLMEQAAQGLKPKGREVQIYLEQLRKSNVKISQESKKQEIGDAIAQHDPELASLIYVRPKPLEEIQKLLPEGTLLLEYFYEGTRGFIFGVMRDEDIVVEQTDWRDILPLAFETIQYEDQVQLVWPCYEEILQWDDDRGWKRASLRLNNIEEVKATLGELYDALIQPMKAMIDKAERLVIVPHGVLHTLPWAALYDERNEEYLFEQKVISLLPSANVLEFCRKKNRKRKENCLVLLNPLTNESELPEDNPQDFFKQSLVLRRQEATRENLFAAINAQIFDVIHLYCHGASNPAEPLYYYLALSNGDVNNPQVIPLYAWEIFNLDLHAWLIVLAACDMGKGCRLPGDEVVAMTRAFFYAGTPSLITPLWAVHSHSTIELFKEFYRNLTDKENLMDKAKALAEAQRRVKNIYEHPYYWSGVVLIGDWE